METLPKISIVIPSYNQGEYLEETILSIIGQQYSHLQLIVIDGGSTDNSIEVIKQYQKYIHYWVTEKDNGQSHAINKGLKLCNGELVSFLNSDDVLLPNVLHEVAQMYNKEEKQIITGPWLEGETVEKAILRHVIIPTNLDNFLINSGLFGQPGTFWSNDHDKNLINEDLHFCLDFELFYRLIKQGFKIKLLDKPVALFRTHPKAKTSTLQLKKYEELVSFYEERQQQHPHLLLKMVLLSKRYKRTWYRLQLLKTLKEKPLYIIPKIWDAFKYDPKVFIKGI